MEGARLEPSPSALVPPFTLRAQVVPRQQARWFLPAPVMGVLMLAVEWTHDARARVFNLLLLLLVVGVQGLLLLLRRGGPRWSFEEAGFEGGGLKGTRGLVRYSEAVDVEGHRSASQRRRGVGTVVVTYRSGRYRGRSHTA